jgi:hypothetical protein
LIIIICAALHLAIAFTVQASDSGKDPDRVGAGLREVLIGLATEQMDP